MPLVKKRKAVFEYKKVTRGGNLITQRTSVESVHQPANSVVNKNGINELPLNTSNDDNILPTTEQQPPAPQGKYSAEKDKRIKKWTFLREPFLTLGRSLFAPNLRCVVCEEETEDIFRCLDCCQWDTLCLGCLQHRHDLPHLHLFEGWKNGTFLIYKSPTPVWKHNNCLGTNCQYEKDIVIIDDKGRQHMRTLTFCRCEEESLCLVRYGLWPATPNNPTAAFSLDLLKWVHALSMDCQVSVKGFCQAIKTRLNKHHQELSSFEIKNIYQVLIKETLEEFRFFLHTSQQLNDLNPEFSDGSECAACYKVTTKVVSLDGDFQLVRKASSGGTWTEAKHAGIFVQQSEVDAFMERYPATNQVEKDCSDFQAGNSIRSKNKNSKLSETAVFGSACRHDFPHLFFSLKHGERIGYSVFLLRKLLEKRPNEKNLHVMYDIACVLKAHLQKNQEHQDLLQKVNLSIPIFHCYGHKAACQVLFSPRRNEGFGLSDGEGMERIWSFLGKFSSITKEMTPENRIDLLSKALLHFGTIIDNNFSKSLVKKMKKAKEVESASQTALQEVLSTLHDCTVADVEDWAAFQKENALKKTVEVIYSKEENYSIVLEKLLKMQTHGVPGGKEQQRLESKAKTLERQLGIQRLTGRDLRYREWLRLAHDKERVQLLTTLQRTNQDYQYLIELNRKYSRGQSIAIRLSRQMKKTMEQIKRTINIYNSLTSATLSAQLPPSLTIEDVRDLDSPLWNMNNTTSHENHPSSLKNQAVELYFMISKSKEEQCMVKEEMQSTILYYKNQHQLALQSFPGGNRAIQAMLLLEGLHLEQKLKILFAAFEPYIVYQALPSDFTMKLGFSEDHAPSKVLQDISAREFLLSSQEDEESESDEESENEQEI